MKIKLDSNEIADAIIKNLREQEVISPLKKYKIVFHVDAGMFTSHKLTAEIEEDNAV